MTDSDDGLKREDIIAYEQCDFLQSKAEDIKGELIVTRKEVIFLKTKGTFRTTRTLLHTHDYLKIKRCSRKDITLVLRVTTAQKVVTFKYRMTEQRAKRLARAIRKEMKRVKLEDEKIAATEKAEKEKQKAADQRKINEIRRKHQIASSIEILEESTLPKLEKQLDVIALKSTDLMVHEFDFLKIEVSENQAVIIEFSVLEATPSFFNIHMFLDPSLGITSTLSGGVSSFQPIEALLSETELGESKLIGFRALRDLNLYLIIYKHLMPKGQFSIHVKTGSITSPE
ncbi:MAG: hypothetical protein ACTSWA_09770 [Candidatus Thorarchaeota archaeon]